MIADFFTPVHPDVLGNAKDFHPASVRNTIQINDGTLPNFEESKAVIIGVPDFRGAQIEDSEGVDVVRSELYRLFAGRWGFEVCDLGDILPGESIEDTQYALRNAVEYLLKQNVIPIILGGSQDLTYSMFKAYGALEQSVNIAAVDSSFDLGIPGQPLSNGSYLSHIVMDKSVGLFNFSNLGYQTYYINKDEVDLMENMFFETHRLGAIQADIREAEPILRDADLISFDINAVRMSEAPSNIYGSPNGFYGEEFCALARYAGMSDKCSTFGIFEYLGEYDQNNHTARLIAQAVWYFLEGVSLRYNDFPFGNRKSYAHYIVPMQEIDMDLSFYKSDKSGRWWIEVPVEPNLELSHNRHMLIPCSYNDYKQATEQEVPDRWWRAFKRLS